jgi:nicotinamide-nucleotide adenylyltransferase
MASGNSLYIGRFRLFHKGYLEVVKYILEENGSDLIIAIGAAEVSHRKDNPFTGEERVNMIESALMQESLGSKVRVIPIDETNARYENWTQLVENLCPPFRLVYSWSELVRLLLKRAGYVTKPVPQFSRREFSFALIVDKVINDKPWEDLVPVAVVRFMREHKLDQRVKKLCSRGERPQPGPVWPTR